MYASFETIKFPLLSVTLNEWRFSLIEFISVAIYSETSPPSPFFFIDQAREGISRAKNDVRLTHQIQAREMVMKMHRHGNAQMTGRILRPGTQPWPQDNY